jgi:hypothetical protein
MGGEFISYMVEGHEYPTARWLLGTDVDQRQAYVIHLGNPTFIAKISDNSDTGLLSGTSFGMRDGRNLYDFVFYGDEPSTEAELVKLFIDAESAITAAHGQEV